MTAPKLIDPRFLEVHPRTRLWWQQREQCAKCTHLVRRPGRTEWQCKAGNKPRDVRSVRWYRSCHDAREEGSQCGPNAVLFSPR